MKRGNMIHNILCAVIFSCVCVLGLTGCGGDSGPTPSNLAITTTSLPEQTVNHPYSASVSGSGGAPPYTWSVSPALPANLSLDTATGAITGTPTTAATTTHTFTLRDSSAPSQTVEQTLSLTIHPPLSITTTSLPDASIAAAYNQPVETVGGIGALTFSIVLPGTGTLPSTLSLNPTTGMISGTPTAPAGTFPFTVRVEDPGGQQDTQALSIRINPTTPPQITTTSLPGGTAGQPYSFRVQATGGIGALVWSVSAGSLPAGLILNQSGPLGGTISGTPLSGGSFNFTVRITDSVGQTDTQDLSISVTPLSITTTSLPPGSIGQAYSQQVQTIGGIAPLTWSISAGTLPPGLNLNQDRRDFRNADCAGRHIVIYRPSCRRRRTSGHASALDRHQPIQRAKYHDHHAPGSNSRSVLQSDVTGKWRNWGTYLECPSRIAPSGSHAHLRPEPFQAFQPVQEPSTLQ